MPRRVSVPAHDELFRATPGHAADSTTGTRGAHGSDEPRVVAQRSASGRVKHEEKVTVYVTSDELFELEHARLELRRQHGLAVDRGRVVRAAVALVLADLDERGGDSALVRRLRDA